MARTLIAGPYAFTGADGTNVSADSANWTEQDGVNGFVRIKSNAFHNEYSAISDCCWNGAGSFTSDQYFEFKIAGTFSMPDGDAIGGNLRNNGGAHNSNTMYRTLYYPSLNGNAGAVQVFKVVNGTPTQLGANINFAMAANDLFSADAVTNGANVDITVYKNGVSQGTRSDTSSVLSGGKPGVTAYNGVGNLLGDDWTAGNITAGGFVGSRRTGLCVGASSVEIGRASGGLFRKNSWGLLVPAWSM